MLIRTIHPEVKVIDAKAGIVDYVASDQSVDSYSEVIKADGWKFDRFRRNAPFVNSHDYSTIENLLGKVTDFRVEPGEDDKPQLVERVQWAIDVPDHKLATLGFKLTESGFLRAVSVGFFSLRRASRFSPDRSQFESELSKLAIGQDEAAKIGTIHLEQDQIELSAVVIGANANALAKAYKAGAITEEDVDAIATLEEEEADRRFARQIFSQTEQRNTDPEADSRVDALESFRRDRGAWLREFSDALNG